MRVQRVFEIFFETLFLVFAFIIFPCLLKSNSPSLYYDFHFFSLRFAGLAEQPQPKIFSQPNTLEKAFEITQSM